MVKLASSAYPISASSYHFVSNTAHYTFETPEQLHAWLRVNHASETELWVRIFKKATGHRHLGRLRGGRYLLGLDRRAAQVSG